MCSFRVYSIYRTKLGVIVCFVLSFLICFRYIYIYLISIFNKYKSGGLFSIKLLLTLKNIYITKSITKLTAPLQYSVWFLICFRYIYIYLISTVLFFNFTCIRGDTEKIPQKSSASIFGMMREERSLKFKFESWLPIIGRIMKVKRASGAVIFVIIQILDLN
jgi:hypothetical protein